MSPIVVAESEVQSPVVDLLGWAASDRRVEAWARRAASPAGPLAASLSPEGLGALGALDRPTIHAAEVFVEPEDGETYLRIREAVVVTNRSARPLDQVALRVLGNALSGREARGAVVLGAWVDGVPVPGTLRGPVLTLPLPRSLPPGRTARVFLHLAERVPLSDAEIPVRTDTLWPDQTGSLAEDDGVLVLGGLLPTLLPLDREGRWDTRVLQANAEPAAGEPALFRVAVTAPATYTVASTGVSQGAVTDGRTTTELLVAAAVPDFSVVLVPDARVEETRVGGTTIRAIAPEGAMPAEDLLALAERSVRILSAPFGPLPAGELEVVEAPARGVDGLDWPGLVLVDASHKGRPWHGSAAQEWAVAHGVAHQWWGHDALSDGLAHPWIDEGLAAHGAELCWEATHGRDAALDRREPTVLGVLEELREEGLPALPADLPSDSYDRVTFPAVVQGRTAIFLDELRSAFGDPAWAAALRDLRSRGRQRRLEPGAVLDTLRAHAPPEVDVDALWRAWMAGELPAAGGR